MAEIRVQHVVVDGVRSLVREAGPAASSEAVVFVHGNPGSSEDWLDLVAHASQFARCIAPDMPGYGKAERPVRFDFTVAGYARHLAGLLDQLGARRVHLVLHDFGGLWGLFWALAHPERVASVTLFNLGVLPGYKWYKIARGWRTPVLGELMQLMMTRGSFRRALDIENPKPFPRSFTDRMFDDMDSGHKRAVLALYRATDHPGSSGGAAAAAFPKNVPVLIVWGEADPYVPSKYAAIQNDYFPAEVHVLPGCGHWPMIDEPETVRALVIPFLQEHARAQVTRPHGLSRADGGSR